MGSGGVGVGALINTVIAEQQISVRNVKELGEISFTSPQATLLKT